MRKLLITSLISALLGLFVVGGPVYAHATYPVNSHSTYKVSELLTTLQKSGYHNFVEVEREHGIFEVEATDSQGQRVKIYYNPAISAATKKVEAKSSQLTMLQAVQKAEAAGYTNIRHAEYEYGRYKIKAFDKFGRGVKFFVDPKSGNLIRY